MYDYKKGKETQPLAAGITADGIIIRIDDAKVRAFVNLNEEQEKKWKGNIDQEAINVTVEVLYKDKDEELKINLAQFFTYKTGTDGDTEYPPKSNMAKYQKYYKKLPQVGDRVKVITKADGFFRLLIE